MNKNEIRNMPLIIECELPDGIEGRYFDEVELILTKDINDKPTLIHEMSHYLWGKKDKQLGKFLKQLRLSFNSPARKAIKNRTISQIVNVQSIMDLYPKELWFDEAIAYFFDCLPEELLRNAGFPLFDRILDGRYAYYLPDGDLVFAMTGEILDNHEAIPEILDFYRKHGVVL